MTNDPPPKNSGNNPHEPASTTPLSFSPAPMKYHRHDKPTPEQQQDFLAPLSAGGASKKTARKMAKNDRFTMGLTRSQPPPAFPH